MLTVPGVGYARPVLLDPITSIGSTNPPCITGHAKPSIDGKGDAVGVGANGMGDGVGDIDETVEKNEEITNEIASGSFGDVTHGQLPIPLIKGPDRHVFFT